MATQEKRGWVWTREEKRLLQALQRKVRKERTTMVKVLGFFDEYVPAFKAEARTRGRPVIAACDFLLSLRAVAGRKFLPVSLDQAMDDAERILAMRQDLEAFARLPDVGAALAEGARKRAAAGQVRKDDVVGLDVRADVEKGLDKVLREASILVWAAQQSTGYGEPGDSNVVMRLFHVQVLRCMHSTGRVASQIERILRAKPRLPMRTILVGAACELFKDSLRHPAGTLPELVNGAGLGLQSVMRELKDAGVAPADIDRRYFRVAGVDLSPGAVPDN